MHTLFVVAVLAAFIISFVIANPHKAHAQATVPTVSLSASPASIPQGQSTTLTWSSTNATSCTASGGWAGTKSTSGSQSVTPGASNTSYIITCTGAGGSANHTVWVPWGTSADTTAPSTPANLTASAASASQINLSWSASTDNVGVTGYQVFRNGTQVGTPSGTSYSDTGLTASTAYSYTVKARDAAGNTSANSNTASATTQAGSTGGTPTVTLTANPASIPLGQSTTLTWSSTNATSCTASGGWAGTKSTSGSESVTPAGANTSYIITCTGTGGSANASVVVPFSSTADTQAPSAPANLTASAASASQINLSWSASTDNVGVTGYQVFRNGTQVGTPSGTSFSDTGLTASTAYSYTVKARDAAGNTSANSNTASATTQAGSTGGTPTVTLTANPTSIQQGQSSTLSWSSTNATSCTLSGGYSAAVGTSGTQVVTPAVSGTTYTVTCTGTGGSASQTATVTFSGSTPPPTPLGSVSVGDTVQVINGPVNVRSAGSLTAGVVGSVPTGIFANVVEGPVSSDGYTWWRLNYDMSYPDGWTSQDFLTVIAENPNLNCVALSIDCAAWQASGIDTQLYPIGVPVGYSWYPGGDQNWGYRPAPSGMTAVSGWSHLYPQLGQPVVPTTIYVRNFKAYAHLITGGWQLIQDQNNATHQIGGGNFVADLAGNSGYPLTVTFGAGFASFPSPIASRMDHWWIDPRGTYAANSVNGVFVISEVRVADANVHYIIQTGADWWRDAGAPYVNPVGTNNPAVGIGSWTKLTTNYQYSYFTNVPRSVLISDPPPPLQGVTPPPSSDTTAPSTPAKARCCRSCRVANSALATG